MNTASVPTTATTIDPRLQALVTNLSYKPGWRFWLEASNRRLGTPTVTLVIHARVPDSSNPTQRITLNHYMAVPEPAQLPPEFDWCRWLLDTLYRMEFHETCEFFRIAGTQPFPPGHGAGADPYELHSNSNEEA